MFEGFSQATIDFMWNIRLNNNKAWFEAHKDEYKRDFHAPMKELGQEVYARIIADYSERGFIHKLSRIYKDARRIRDGNPYRDHLWFSVERPSAEGEESSGVLTFWFDLNPEGWSYGLGYYAAKAVTMENVRASINKKPHELEKLIDLLGSQEEFKLEGDAYARQKQAPTIKTQEWYNKKSFSLIHYGTINDELFSRDFANRLVNGYKFLMPFYDYFIVAERNENK
ncbi:MAG: DUF2461 domain-containing protein [Defluviitaleaceae bacterium]|nr:DUF2461 domain-containing protein [Defluviitaleaceae bacterium]MCL2238396.1 DUF2461 domain-containing protein [Defluviitaleaceae bacterium]